VVPSEGPRTLVIPQDGDARPGAGVVPEPLQAVIHVSVFARYTRPEGDQIIKDVGYLNAASGDDFHLVLAGYSHTWPRQTEGRLSDPIEIKLPLFKSWYYDDQNFARQVQMIEGATTWEYGGGLQLVICDVMVPGRHAATTQEIFTANRGLLEHVIVIDVDELKDKKLFADFEHFFARLRTIIRDVRSTHTEKLTWALSDRLGVDQGGVALRTIAKALKLDFWEAFDSAMSLKSFAVRDIRKKP
jgi:hypothetical protein